MAHADLPGEGRTRGWSAVAGAVRLSPLGQAVNNALHDAFFAAPCEVDCLHVMHGDWTALDVASVFSLPKETEDA